MKRFSGEGVTAIDERNSPSTRQTIITTMLGNGRTPAVQHHYERKSAVVHSGEQFDLLDERTPAQYSGELPNVERDPPSDAEAELTLQTPRRKLWRRTTIPPPNRRMN